MRLSLKTLTRRPVHWALGLLALVGVGSTALAAPIEVKDHSFESAGLDPGGWVNDLGTAWVGQAGPSNGGAFLERIEGFVSEGTHHIGMQNEYFVYQRTGVPVEPNTTYTLTVGVGNRNANFSPEGALAIIGLTALEDGATLEEPTAVAQVAADPSLSATAITVDSFPIGASTFADTTLTFTTGADVPAGNVTIFLGDDVSGGRAHFDNVRLWSQPAGTSIGPGVEFQAAFPVGGPENPIVNPPFRLGDPAGDLAVFEPFGGGTYDGPDDQSSSTVISWDSDNVYLNIMVTDDYHENAANSGWNGDAVQLHVANAARDTQVALYNFALGGVEGDLGDIVIHEEAGPGGPLASITREGTLTSYHITLPAASLGLDALTPGTQLGLGFTINDGDEAEPGQKGWGGLGAHSVVFGKTPSETALVTLVNLNEGLIAYFPFDGDLNDHVGDSHGEAAGTEPIVFGPGVFGDAIDLDGVDQHVRTPVENESMFDFSDGTGFSVSAWFRVDAFEKNWQAIVTKGEGSNWRVHRRGGENHLAPVAGANAEGNGVDIGLDGPNVDDGQFHHVVITNNPGVDSRFYLDGVLIGEGPGGAPSGNEWPMMIGENAHNDGHGRTWNGPIDDVAVWNRNLGAGEVAALFNGPALGDLLSGKTLAITEEGLDGDEPAVIGDVFDEDALTFSDRTHQHNGAAFDDGGVLSTGGGNIVPLPDYLVGNPYYRFANNARDNDYLGTLTSSSPCYFYLLVDNRVNGPEGNTSSPNSEDPVLGGTLQWVIDGGWQRVSTGISPNGQADYTAVDEGGDSVGPGLGLNQFYSVFALPDARTEATVGSNGTGGSNMISVVVSPVEPTFAGPPTADPVPLPFHEDFDSVALGPNVDETVPGDNVWTATPPAGWNVDNSAMTPGGVTEWQGWTFADPAWWASVDDQRRSEFTKASGAAAIADPDEWDDIGDPSDAGTFNSFLNSPPIIVDGVDAVDVGFDFSWRPEGDQKGNLTASFDGGDPVEVFLLDTATSSDMTNETAAINIPVPDGAQHLELSFGMFDAGNNWFFAVDNLWVDTATPPVEPIDEFLADFELPDGTTDLGPGTTLSSNDGIASVQGGQLRLTEAGTNSSQSAFTFGVGFDGTSGWTLTGDATVSHTGGNTPADGFSVNYGAIPGPDNYGNPAEEGYGPDVVHVSYQVDTWKWDDAGQDAGVEIEVSGEKTGAFNHAINDDANFKPDETVSFSFCMTWDPVNGASFITEGLRTNADFIDIPTDGFVASPDHYFSIIARTGGHNETVLIDNLVLTKGAQSKGGPEPIPDGALKVHYEFETGTGNTVRNLAVEADDRTYDAEADFITFPADWWTGANWDEPNADGNNVPWTTIGAEVVHPNGDNNGEIHWAVRRWQAPAAGTGTIEWHVSKDNLGCGNGVSGGLYQNGVELDFATIAFDDGEGVTRTVEVEAAEGDVFDLVQTPLGTDGTNNDGCDGSVTWMTVTVGGDVIADSVAQFTTDGTQGADGWTSGYVHAQNISVAAPGDGALVTTNDGGVWQSGLDALSPGGPGYMYFDSANGADATYVDTGFTPADLGIENAPYTMMARVRQDALGDGNNADAMVFGQAGGEVLHNGARGENLHLGHWGNDVGGGSVSLGQWRHIAYRYTGTDTGAVEILLDGVVVASDTKGGLFKSADTILIGTTRLDQNRDFIGCLDDVRIYCGALTDEQIQCIAFELGGITGGTFNVRNIQAADGTQFDSMDAFQAALGDPAAVSADVTAAVGAINFMDNGNDGFVGGGVPFPLYTGEPGVDHNDFGVHVTGQFYVTESGPRTFDGVSDDGNLYFIDGVHVGGDPGLHGNNDAFGTIDLAAGLHHIEAFYFERGGGASFEILMAQEVGEFASRGDATFLPLQAAMVDKDGDGIDDNLEISLFGSIEARDGTGDFDGDRLNDATESRLGTDLTNRDTDGDGLWDGAEVIAHHTDPLNADSDSDGLNDGNEAAVVGSDPNDEDSDNDSLTDGDEVAGGSDPNVFNEGGAALLVHYDFNPPAGGGGPGGVVAYANDFTYDNDTTDLGDGSEIASNDGTNSVQDNALRMTQAGVNSTGASFKFDAGDVSGGWEAHFDFVVEHTGENTPADGFSFNWGVIPEGENFGNPAEEGYGDITPHVSFQVDTWLWDDEGQDAGVGIEVSGVEAAFNKAFGDDANFKPEERIEGKAWISWDPVNGASFSTEGLRVNADFENIPIEGLAPDGSYAFSILARTGGHNETVIIDNLVVTRAPNVYANDFTYDNDTTDLGDGSEIASNDGTNSVQDNALRMTQAGVNSTGASFKLPPIDFSNGWEAHFDFVVEHTGDNTPADGFSFNYGVIPEGENFGNPAEEGYGDITPHVSFQVDTWLWDDEGQDAGVGIEVSGVEAAFNKAFGDDANFKPEERIEGTAWISWDPVNGASFSTEGLRVNADFENIPIEGLAPDASYGFSILARTGGHNETVIIDNLVVREPGAGASPNTVANLGSAGDGTLIAPDGVTLGDLTRTTLGDPTMSWTELAGNNSIPTFNNAFDGADVLDGTWRVWVDFEPKADGQAELVFETGGGTIGLSLVYEAPSTLVLRAVGNGGNDVITARAPLTPDQLGAGPLEVIFTHDGNDAGPETVAIWLDGHLAGSASGEKSNDFSGGNGASFGLGTGSLAAGGGNTNLPGGSGDFVSGTIVLDPGLQFFRDTLFISGALRLTGDPDTWVDTNNSSDALGVNGNDASYTMLARIRPDAVGDGNNGDAMIFGQESGSALHNGIRGTGFHFGHWGNDSGGGSVTLGQWYNAAWRYSGGVQSLFIDGELVSSAARGGLNNPGNIIIGTTRTDQDRAFPGLIDDIKIYAGGLSQAAIQAAQGLGAPGAAQLLVQYEFEDGITTTIRNDGNQGAPDGSLNALDVVGAFPSGEFSPSTGGHGSMFFDAANNADSTYIHTGLTAAQAGVNGETNYTMMAWAKPTNDANGDQMIFGQTEGNTLHNGIRDRRLHIGHWGNDLNAGAARVTYNQWQHLAFSYDTAGNQTAFINGVEVASEVHGGLNNPDSPIIIGSTRLDQDRDYQGFLDDVRIYSGTLTAAEISQIAGLGDGDGDGLQDWFERANFGNLAMDGTGDPDDDGITNADEERLGLDPNVSDAQFADNDNDQWTAGDEEDFGTSDNNGAQFPQIFVGGGQWEVRIVQAESDQIGTLAAADALLNGELASIHDTVTLHDFINFGDGGNGLFDGDTQWPNEAEGDQNDFVMHAKGVIETTTGGAFSFNLRTDDGGRVIINGQNVWNDDSTHGDRNGIHEVNLPAGRHEVEVTQFERGGGDNAEWTGAIRTDNSLSGLGGPGYILVPAAPPAEGPVATSINFSVQRGADGAPGALMAPSDRTGVVLAPNWNNVGGPDTIEILGTGAESLLGGDLTDPEDDGLDELGAAGDPSWNWVAITASHEPDFEGGENSFNIFDNKVGGGNDKWCCDDPTPEAPVWVDVEFAEPISLTHFTITNGNDAQDRDPTNWQIQGSNDGENYDTIFGVDDGSIWSAERLEVALVTLGTPSAPYTHLRYIAFDTPGTLHQLNEIEYFGGGLIDSRGNPSGIGVEWATNTTWTTFGDGPTDPTEKMMDGYLDDTAEQIDGGDYSHVTLSNIPYPSYDLIAYFTSDGNDRSGATRLNGGEEVFLLTAGNNRPPEFIQATATTEADAAPATFAQWAGLSGDTATVEWRRISNNVGLAGIQVVDASGGTPPPDGLLAYCDFDGGPGNPLDLVNGLEAVLTDGAVIGEGLTGGAADFGPDAAGPTLVVEPSFLEPIAFSDQLTVAFYQNLSAVTNSSAFWATSAASDRSFQAHTPWGNGSVFFDTAGCCGGDTQRISGAVDTPVDTWQHFTFVKNGSEKKVYLDGVEVLAGENTLPIPGDFATFNIGSDPAGNNSLAGRIDEFSIWSVALSPEDIAALAAGAPAWDPNAIPTTANSSAITSPADVDTSGDIVYAVNVGGPGGLTVGDANFTADTETPGLSFFAQNHIPEWGPLIDFGDTAEDDAMEAVLNSIRWTAVNNDPSGLDFDFEVMPGGNYQVSLLFAEKCCDRGFDVLINGALVADEHSPDVVQGEGNRGVAGSQLVVQFTQRSSLLEIDLDGIDADFPDRNAILMGVLVEHIGGGGGGGPMPIAHWPLDEITDGVSPDVVGGHHMTAVNLTADDVVPGARGNAIAFDNSRETILEYIAPDGNDGPLPVNNSQAAFSIGMWVKVAGEGQNDLRLFSEASTTDNGPLFNIGTANDGGDGSVDIYIRGGDPTVNHPHTTATPFDDTWHHLMYVQDGATANVFIDGVLDDIALDVGEAFLADPGVVNTVSIGGIRRAAASHWVTGTIDDVKVWNQALTPEQIAAEANGGVPQVTSSKELVDSDYDGMSDLAESIAGTNPNDPSDYFHISRIAHGENGLSIEFDAVAGIAYEIEYSEDLSPNSWQVIGSESAGEASVVEFIDTDETRAQQGFYRARVVQD